MQPVTFYEHVYSLKQQRRETEGQTHTYCSKRSTSMYETRTA